MEISALVPIHRTRRVTGTDKDVQLEFSLHRGKGTPSFKPAGAFQPLWKMLFEIQVVIFRKKKVVTGLWKGLVHRTSYRKDSKTAEWQEKCSTRTASTTTTSLGLGVSILIYFPEELEGKQSTTRPRKGIHLSPESGGKCPAYLGLGNSGKNWRWWQCLSHWLPGPPDLCTALATIGGNYIILSTQKHQQTRNKVCSMIKQRVHSKNHSQVQF